MSSSRSSSKKRTTSRKKSVNQAVESLKNDAFEKRYYTISVRLHVKKTKLQGKANSDVPPEPRPFEHPSLSNFSIKKPWIEIENAIKNSLLLPEFEQLHGIDLKFDESLGIIGWMGKRSRSDNPKTKLGKKATVSFKEQSAY